MIHMTDTEVEAVFRHLVQAFSIPVQLEAEDRTIFYMPRYPITPNPAYLMVARHLSSPPPVFHIITSDNAVSGCVTYAGGTRHLILGPVLSRSLSSSEIIRLMRSLNIPMTQLDEAIRFVNYLPEMTVSAFCETLSFAASLLIPGGDTRSIQLALQESDIPISDIQHKEPQRFIAIRDQSIITKEQISRAISEGRPDKLLQLIDAMPQTNTPIVTKDSSRVFKDTVIAATSAIAQIAMASGLDTQTAFSLSDYYINQIEQIDSYVSLSRLIITIMLDYSRRVAMAKLPTAKSETVSAVYHDVKNHLREPLSASDIASRLGLTTSHVCHIFKNETGTTLGEYIRSRKVEEAQMLLLDTRMDIGNIAQYIGMSPAAFYAAFKRVTHMTPTEYRKTGKR